MTISANTFQTIYTDPVGSADWTNHTGLFTGVTTPQAFGIFVSGSGGTDVRFDDFTIVEFDP